MSHSSLTNVPNDPDTNNNDEEFSVANSLPVKESEDHPPINDTENVGHDWLTFRRRCELCKQRKVRQRQVTFFSSSDSRVIKIHLSTLVSIGSNAHKRLLGIYVLDASVSSICLTTRLMIHFRSLQIARSKF